MFFIPKMIIKLSFQCIFWLVLFSISIKGRTLFSYAHEVVIRNEFVENIDDSLSTAWHRVSNIAGAAYAEFKKSNSERKN